MGGCDWCMAWVRQYSAPNVVGARKLKASIFYTINPLLRKTATLRFRAHLWGLGTTYMYAVHLRLIGKPVVDFLLVIIELFSLGAMVQALQANWKSIGSRRF